MALVDNSWYVNFGNGSSTGYYAVTAWATGATIAAGALRRQLAAPAVGSERVFVCIVAGTTHATTEPTWVITRGGKTTDNTVTWQECTGIAALNGDATNTPSWTITATPPGGVKNTAVTLGQVIKRDNGASYWICTTAGTAGNGSEPAWANDTAGTTRTDNTATWTCLGVVGNFTIWSAPHARVANALTSTWGAAGNTFFMSSAHAETQSSALTWNGPAAGSYFIYGVKNAPAATPPGTADMITGASVTTTGNSAMNILNGSGAGYNFYCYGIAFNCGTTAVSPTLSLAIGSNTHFLSLDACQLNIPATGASAVLKLGVAGWGRLVLNNTTCSFGASGHKILPSGNYTRWQNTASAIAGVTSLFGTNAGAGNIDIVGVDLSAITGTMFSNNLFGLRATLIDCKLGAGVTIAAPATEATSFVDLIRCDSGATNYRTERYRYVGTQTVETTIVRTGGATDGTTPIALKIVTTANSKWVQPFESQPITIWNDSTSSVTVTIYGIWGGGAVPNNDDIWIEAEYLGSSSTPLGSFATATKANNLATGSALTSDSSTWGGSTTAFKMSVTFTPGQKGPINLVVKAAKISSTFYIDPKPSISGVTVSKSMILAPGVYANELSTGSGASRARTFSGLA